MRQLIIIAVDNPGDNETAVRTSKSVLEVVGHILDNITSWTAIQDEAETLERYLTHPDSYSIIPVPAEPAQKSEPAKYETPAAEMAWKLAEWAPYNVGQAINLIVNGQKLGLPASDQKQGLRDAISHLERELRRIDR